MNSLYPLIALLVCVYNLTAQNEEKNAYDSNRDQPIVTFLMDQTNSVDFESGNTYIISPQRIIYNDVEGSVYLNETWQPGFIMSNKMEKIKVLARYDAYHDQMHIKRKKEDEPRMIHPNMVRAISVGNEIFVSRAFEDKGEIKVGYFQLLVEGKCMLLVRKYKMKMPGYRNPALQKEKPVDKIQLLMDYYITGEDNQVTKFKKGKRSVKKLTGDNFKEIDKYAAKNDLGYKKEEDLIKIFERYNAILDGEKT